MNFIKKFLTKHVYKIIGLSLILLIILNSVITSKAYKYEDILNKNENLRLLSVFEKRHKNIQEITIVEYSDHADVYYEFINDVKPKKSVDTGSDEIPFHLRTEHLILTNEQLIYLKQNYFLSKVYTHKKITFRQATFSDNYKYNVADPIKAHSDAITTVLSLLLSFGFIIVMIVHMRRMKGGKTKFTITQPNDIKDSFHDLQGYEEVKEEFRNFIDIYQNRNRYKEYGVDEGFNIMLKGPAGVGKTRGVACLAKELNLPLLSYTFSSLETGYIGGGPQTIDNIVEAANKFPECIVFFDEAESLFSQRTNSENGQHYQKTKEKMLASIDGVHSNSEHRIIWIAATNFNEGSMNMDEAMLRRFHIKIDFRKPNPSERESILKHYLKDVAEKHIGHIDYNYLKGITAGLSPAVIKTVVKKASAKAAFLKTSLDTKLLMKEVEHQFIGTISNDEKDDDLRELVGFHELGHFIVNYDLLKQKYETADEINKHLKLQKISVESASRFNALGFNLSAGDDRKLHTKEDLENQVMIFYGGEIAEKIFKLQNNTTNGCSMDITQATNILHTMFRNYSMYSNKKLNYDVINNPQKNYELLKDMEEKAEELYNKAFDIVKKNEELVRFLNKFLTKQYYLTKPEVLEKIAEFYNADGKEG